MGGFAGLPLSYFTAEALVDAPEKTAKNSSAFQTHSLHQYIPTTLRLFLLFLSSYHVIDMECHLKGGFHRTNFLKLKISGTHTHTHFLFLRILLLQTHTIRSHYTSHYIYSL